MANAHSWWPTIVCGSIGRQHITAGMAWRRKEPLVSELPGFLVWRYVCVPQACLQRQEEGTRPPGTGVTVASHHVGAGYTSPGPLEEQHVLLTTETTESSLQPLPPVF